MKPFIENHRMRYIVPFSFNMKGKSLRDITVHLGNAKDEFGGKFVHSSIYMNEQDVYQYVLDSISKVGMVSDSNIGSYFIYEKATDSNDVILSLEYRSKKDSEPIAFAVRDMGLFIFDSGVGFLWYEIGEANTKLLQAIPGASIDELIEINNSFKELNYESNRRKIVNVNSDKEFTMGDFVARILANIEDIRFYGHRESTIKDIDAPKYVPDKALTFNYVHFYKDYYNECYDDSFEKSDLIKKYKKQVDIYPIEESSNGIDWKAHMEKWAYYMTKGYKPTYEVPDEIVNEMFKPFKNAIWYIAKEGAGYYVLSNKESGNNNFFRDGMYKKVINDYFLVYILALHQSYTMLKFAEEIAAELPSSPNEYLMHLDENYEDDVVPKENLERELSNLVTRVNVFITKGVKASISYVGHQNDFFIYVKDRLNIQKDVDNVTHGLESLQEIIFEARQNQEARQEKNRDDKLNFIIGILSLVAFVSAIYDGLCLIYDFFVEGDMGNKFNTVLAVKVGFWTFIGIFLLVMLGVGRIVFPKFTDFTDIIGRKIDSLFHWRKEKELRELKKHRDELFDHNNKDGLTGVYNRAGKEYYEKLMINEARKKHKDIYVCVADLNGLKHINDTFCHESGDSAITAASKILSGAIGNNGKVFRTGGDEFLIIGIVDKKSNIADEVANYIRREINIYNDLHSDLPYKLGISIGSELRAATAKLKNLDEMINLADKHMYKMKQETDQYMRE